MIPYEPLAARFLTGKYQSMKDTKGISAVHARRSISTNAGSAGGGVNQGQCVLVKRNDEKGRLAERAALSLQRMLLLELGDLRFRRRDGFGSLFRAVGDAFHGDDRNVGYAEEGKHILQVFLLVVEGLEGRAGTIEAAA